MTLDEFVEQERNKLTKFQKYWTERNKVSPEIYPMDIPQHTNDGWDDMFDKFKFLNVV